jgi:hypothetical protein
VPLSRLVIEIIIAAISVIVLETSADAAFSSFRGPGEGHRKC